MNTTNQLEFLTIEEMQKLLKISRSKSYALIREAGFPKIKIGRIIRIEKNELFSWLQKNNVL